MCAAREIAEEAGIIVEPEAGVPLGCEVFPGITCPAGQVGTHYDLRYAGCIDGGEVRRSSEHLAVDWMPVDAPWAPHDEDFSKLLDRVRALLDR